MRKPFPSYHSLKERRQFTRLHRIILQLLYIDLDQDLCRDNSEIDAVDTEERTALCWAAARGDAEAVRVLLKHGADPNIADRIGQGALR